MIGQFGKSNMIKINRNHRFFTHQTLVKVIGNFGSIKIGSYKPSPGRSCHHGDGFVVTLNRHQLQNKAIPRQKKSDGSLQNGSSIPAGNQTDFFPHFIWDILVKWWMINAGCRHEQIIPVRLVIVQYSILYQ